MAEPYYTGGRNGWYDAAGPPPARYIKYLSADMRDTRESRSRASRGCGDEVADDRLATPWSRNRQHISERTKPRVMGVSESRVFLIALGVVALLVGAGRALGIAEGRRILGLFVFVGVGILGPQLYLAVTDRRSPFARVRTGLLSSLLFVGGAYALTPPGERGLLVAAAATLVLALAISEGLRVGGVPELPGR